MFGKKLSDINTKKNHKSDYFSKSGLIAHNKIYSFYMKKKLQASSCKLQFRMILN